MSSALPLPTDSSDEPEPARHIVGRDLQTPTGAAVAGLAFTILFATSFLLLRQRQATSA